MTNMSAQPEMTERVPASAPAASAPKQYFKGVVKQVSNIIYCFLSILIFMIIFSATGDLRVQIFVLRTADNENVCKT